MDVSSYHPNGWIRSVQIAPPGLVSWGQFTFNHTAPSGTSIYYTIEGYNGTTWVTLFNNITSGPVDLSGVDASVYKRLRLTAHLATANSTVTPEVDWWSVTYYKQ